MQQPANHHAPPVSPRRATATLFLCLVAMTFAATSPAAAVDATATLSTAERAELIELLQRSQAETLEMLAEVDNDQWFQRPQEDRWSVAEIVEHLVLAEGAVRGNVTALLQGEPDPDWQTRKTPSLAEMVRLGSDRSQKFTAPEPIQPTGKLGREEAIMALLEVRAESVRYVLSTDAPLAAHSAPSPIGQVLDGRGWLALLGAHNVRHNRQLAEVIEILAAND